MPLRCPKRLLCFRISRARPQAEHHTVSQKDCCCVFGFQGLGLRPRILRCPKRLLLCFRISRARPAASHPTVSKKVVVFSDFKASYGVPKDCCCVFGFQGLGLRPRIIRCPKRLLLCFRISRACGLASYGVPKDCCCVFGFQGILRCLQRLL